MKSKSMMQGGSHMEGGVDTRQLLPAENHKDETFTDLKTRVWIESKNLWRVAFPTVISRVSQYGVLVVTQLFLGRVGDLELAAYAFIQNIFVRFAIGIILGMSSATETMCGQAFGAKQYHMLGIYLQRSWIVDGAVATMLLPLLIFGGQILALMGQDEELTLQAGRISLWFIPYLYSYMFGLTIQMYLQAQAKNSIVGCLASASFVLHLFLSWLFVIRLGLGVDGAMAALTISSWFVVVGEFVYVFGGWCPDTWKGLKVAALNDLLPLVKLSISSGIMLCLELWYNAVLLIVAGYMKNTTVAVEAFSICLNICTWELMIGLGFQGGSCVRVSNELGRGDARAVKFSIKVALITNSCFGLFFWIICLAFGREISYMFTSSEEVAETVSSLSVFLSFSILLNSFQTILVGVVIGTGLQSMAAIVNLGSFYLIGVPIGAFLAYVARLQVNGLWMGLLSGILTQTVIFGYIIWRTDWDYQVKEASERLDRWFLKEEEDEEER